MAILELIEDNDVHNPFLLNNIPDLAKKEFEELTKEEQDALLDQVASQVANDPKAYERLATEFLKQVKKDDFNTVTIQPQPGYVCKTHIVSSSSIYKVNTPVYINICYASAIPAPPVASESQIQKALNAEPDATFRIPLSMGEIRRGDKDCIIMDACIHTQPYLRSEKDLDFRLYILELSMEYVEEGLKVELSREFTMPKIKSKGDIPGRILRLPKPSLISAIRTEAKQKSKNKWTFNYTKSQHKDNLIFVISMPDKNTNSWMVDITLNSVIISLNSKLHEIPIKSDQLDIQHNSNKVDFYLKSNHLVIQLKLKQKTQYL